MSETPNPVVAVDLLEDGVLWLINSTVFHPRGFALTVAQDDNGNHLGLLLQGDGTEVWQYGTDPDNPGRVDVDAKLAAVNALFARAAKANAQAGDSSPSR